VALDPIVRGCDWQATLIVEPTAGRTPADVSSELVGGSVAVRLHSSSEELLLTGTASITSTTNRTVGVSFTAVQTGGIVAQLGCVLDVRLTTSGGLVRPIQVRERIDVRDLTVGART
jgi:hypothetical protein